MTDCRKLPARATALLTALAWAGAAQGQFCTVAAQAPHARAEGLAELTGDIALACLDNPIAGEAQEIEVSVELNNGVAFANRIDSADATQGIELEILHSRLPPSPDWVNPIGVLEAGNRVVFTFTNPAIPAGKLLSMRIAGIRVNASTAGDGNPISASVRFGPYAPFNDATPLVIARPRDGLIAAAPDPMTGLQCVSGDETVPVLITEGFASAFINKNRQTGQDHGLRLLLELNDIPAGVDAFAPILLQGGSDGNCLRKDGAADMDDPQLQLRLLTDVSSLGAGGAVYPYDAATQDNEYEIPLASGSGYAVYEVTNSDPQRIEECGIAVRFVWEHADDKRIGIGRGEASVKLAPLSGAAQASKTAPIPRFVENGESETILITEPCSTTLLFPFVINRAGFGTGIIISNTSQDAFGTEEQAGSCAIDYYGETAGGGAAPNAQTSSVVAAGERLLFTLSEGNDAAGIAPTPEFQGYLTARCDFQYAHGIALISDGFGGIPSILYGYLPLILPRIPPHAHRPPQPSGLRH